MPRMWNQYHANPIGLKVLSLKWAPSQLNTHCLQQHCELVARSIVAHFKILSFPMSRDQLKNGATPLCGVIALLLPKFTLPEEDLCELITRKTGCLIHEISLDESFSATHAQEAILSGLQNTLISQGWSQLGNKQKLEQLWVRNLDLVSPKATMDAVKMEVLFNSSISPGKYEVNMSLEALKVTIRKWGGNGPRGSPEVFLLPGLMRGTVCEDQPLDPEEGGDLIMASCWIDARAHALLQKNMFISVSKGNVEDGDIIEQRVLVPAALLLSEKLTEKKMSKSDSEIVLREFRQLLVSAGFPKCIDQYSSQVEQEVTLQECTGWARSSGLSQSAPLWTNGHGIIQSIPRTVTLEKESESPNNVIPTQRSKLTNCVVVELESVISKYSSNCPNFPTIPDVETPSKSSSDELVGLTKRFSGNKKKKRKIAEPSRTPLGDIDNNKSVSLQEKILTASGMLKKPRSKAPQVSEPPLITQAKKYTLPSLSMMKKLKLANLKTLCHQNNITPFKTKSEIIQQLVSLTE